MIHDLSKTTSIANQYLAEMRDHKIQIDKARFRNNMQRIGECFAFEISKHLEFEVKEVETPLGLASCQVLKHPVVIAGIMRAGLPMHEGMLHVFNDAESAFIASSRVHHKDGTFEVESSVVSCPDINGKNLIIVDAVIATGSTMEETIQSLKEFGDPNSVHIACTISSSHGLELLSRKHPKVHLWLGAEDEELTAKSFVVPGMGNAGELSYGEKIK
ncbi:MAG: uracil phosphoribosyltransferase [Bacteroidota bacterium]